MDSTPTTSTLTFQLFLPVLMEPSSRTKLYGKQLAVGSSLILFFIVALIEAIRFTSLNINPYDELPPRDRVKKLATTAAEACLTRVPNDKNLPIMIHVGEILIDSKAGIANKMIDEAEDEAGFLKSHGYHTEPLIKNVDIEESQRPGVRYVAKVYGEYMIKTSDDLVAITKRFECTFYYGENKEVTPGLFNEYWIVDYSIKIN